MEALKDRIAHIMRVKNLTAAQFADHLDVQRSGISHLLSGRNKPSLDFIMKLKEKFPEFNLDWIVLGKEPITTTHNSNVSELRAESNLFSSEPKDNSLEEFPESVQFTGNQASNNKKTSSEGEEVIKNQSSKEIVRLIVVYGDNTFKQLNPSKEA